MAATSHTWTVDAVEEGVAAVVEDGARLRHVPAWLLPAGAREGDVLAVAREEDAGGAVTLRVHVDRAATEAALRESRARLERLAASDGGGDIVL